MSKKRKKLVNYLMREQGYSDQAATREADEILQKRKRGTEAQDDENWRRGPFKPDHGI